MLSKEKRLNLKKDFNNVAKGEKISNNLVKLSFVINKENKTPKIGIALSKTVFKKATQRNRVRRLISTGFENIFLKLPEGINIIAFPKEEVINLGSEEVTKSLEALLKSNGLMK